MEQRRASRRVPLREEPIARVRLRTGRDMSVLNVSNTGVLVEGHARLLPGTHVDAHVVTREGRLLVRSRVVRCWVAALQPEAVWYRGALAFDRQVDTASAGYAFPEGLQGGLDAQGHDYPALTTRESAPRSEGLST